MSNMLRKDFYIYLPVYLQNELEAKLNEFSNEEWFAAAWEQYRTHVLSTPKMHMQTPNLFFSQFIKKEETIDIPEETVIGSHKQETVSKEVVEEPELVTAELVSEEPKEQVEGFGEMLSDERQETIYIPEATEEEILPSEESEKGLSLEYEEEKEEEEIENEEFNRPYLEEVEENI